jgi:hypothetical protein
MRLPDRARPLWAWIVAHQPWSILAPLLAVQWLAVLGLAVSVHHNGWLFYQGGDQTFYWTDAHLLTKWTLPLSAVGYAWSYMLMPIALVAGANVLSGLPAVVLLNTLVLLPVALLCVYGIGTRIAGRIFGYWAALLWVVVPYAAIPMFDHRYHQKYVEITLPQQLGLGVLGDFPSMVFLLLTAFLLVRAVDTCDWRDAALAGIVLSFAIGIKPSNTLFVGAAVLCLLVARRWLQLGTLLAAMVPGLLLLALWKERGLGQLPAFASLGGNQGQPATVAAGLPLESLTTPFHKYIDLNWGQLHRNIDGVREFFWAVRPLEFVPLAGLLAIGRRSWPKAVLVFFWFTIFFFAKGSSDQANVEDASFFRLLMPSFPAFLLLLASLPLLVPDFGPTKRLWSVPAPSAWRPGRRLFAVVATVAVVLPLIVIAGTSAQSKAEAVTVPVQGVFVPVRDMHLEATVIEGRVRLRWQPYTGTTRIFYTVLRSRPIKPDPSNPKERKSIDGIACRPRINGSPIDCEVYMERLAATRLPTYVDRPRKGGQWTYRVTVSANWVDDPSLGDALLLSKPVTVTIPR